MLTLTAGNSTGLLSETPEEEEIVSQFYNYGSSVLGRDRSASAFNVSTQDLGLGYIPYVIRYAWSKIYKQQHTATPRNFRILGNSASYVPSTTDPAARLKSLMYWDRYNNSNPKPFALTITLVKRGMTIFDDLNTHFTQETRLTRLETVLTKDRYHKCRVYRDSHDTLHYVTNKWEALDIYKLIGMLPLFYETMLTDPADETNEAFKICAALYNNDTEALKTLILTDIAGIAEAEAARVLESFQTNMTRVGSNNTMQLKRDIANKRQSIENLYVDIFNREQTLSSLERQLFASELCPTTVDPAVIEFLKRSKAIKLVECDESYAVWDIYTPITNYNKADVEMFFKRTERNVFNTPDWLGKLIIATFIDEKYQMMTQTKIGMHWNDPNNWRKYHDTDTRFGNPHITNYNCFSSTKMAVHKALQNGQMLAAINMIIAAAATITFTDGAVTEKLSDALKNYAKPLKIFRDVETGELISALDFIDILTAKEEAKLKPAKAPVVEEAIETEIDIPVPELIYPTPPTPPVVAATTAEAALAAINTELHAAVDTATQTAVNAAMARAPLPTPTRQRRATTLDTPFDIPLF